MAARRSPRPPGAFALAWARCFRRGTRARVLLELTVADLQHEVALTGGHRIRRSMVCARGYVACVSVLVAVACGACLRYATAPTRLAPVLGVIGGSLFLVSFQLGRSGPLHLSPYLLMAVLTPMALRYFGVARDSRRVFRLCLDVGSVMSILLYLLLAVSVIGPRMGLLDHSWRLAFLLGCVTMGSAAVAGVDWLVVSAYRRLTTAHE